MDYSRLRIGYVPLGKRYLHPFDLRNFVYFAKKRGIPFEIFSPEKKYDAVVLAPNADVTVWSSCPYGGPKIIFQFVDSYLAAAFSLKNTLRGLAKYLAGEHRILRLDYSRSVIDMCSRADAVVCATEEQRDYIGKFCPKTHIVLEFNHGLSLETKKDYSIGSVVNLVWEGRPENTLSLGLIKEALVDLNEKYALALHVITDLSYKKFMGKTGSVSIQKLLKKMFGATCRSNTVGGRRSLVYLYQWNPSLMSRIVTGCDIAVLPLNSRDSLMWGKPENRLVLFWRMAMPVVVSATPAYRRAMERAGLDHYCENKNEWEAKLENMILDVEARKRSGLLGKKAADDLYSEEKYLRKWDEVLSSVLA